MVIRPVGDIGHTIQTVIGTIANNHSQQIIYIGTPFSLHWQYVFKMI